MIVGTSVLLAVVLGEEEKDVFLQALENNAHAKMSVASYLEAHLRILRDDSPVLKETLQNLVSSLSIELEPVTIEQINMAIDAFNRYGKGRGHPAQLNYGDCFTYALAKSYSKPLLFKGNDFSHTDLWLHEASSHRR